MTGLTWDMVAEMNANHAHRTRGAGAYGHVDVVGQNSAAAAAAIRAMTDAQLDTTVPNSLYGDAPLTLQFWLEDHPVSHSYKHLANIKTMAAKLQLNGVVGTFTKR